MKTKSNFFYEIDSLYAAWQGHFVLLECDGYGRKHVELQRIDIYPQSASTRTCIKP